jgi:hypothetical protein
LALAKLGNAPLLLFAERVDGPYLFTVASRPKILQNNSKPAVEKIHWPREFGGRTAAFFGQSRPNKNIFGKFIIFFALWPFFLIL